MPPTPPGPLPSIVLAICNSGLGPVPLKQRRRVQTASLMALVGFTATTLYAVAYALLVPSRIAAVVTEACAMAYLLHFALLALGRPYAARVVTASVFLSNLCVSSLILFNQHSGFYLFFIVVAPMAWLVFDPEERLARNAVTVASAVLYVAVFFLPPLHLVGQVPPAFETLAMFTTPPGVALVLMAGQRVFVRELEEREAVLDRAVRTDTLTGLPNRSAILATAEAAEAYAHRHGARLAVMMVDLDHFKHINDELGHATGDVALARVAGTMRDHLRVEDTLGRVGGEEFLVLCPGVDGNGAWAAAERLRRAVDQLRIEGTGGEGPHCTVSIGIAELGRAERVAATIRRADRALYRAKAEGRNRSVLDVAIAA